MLIETDVNEKMPFKKSSKNEILSYNYNKTFIELMGEKL